MREVIARAEVGDDVIDVDPTLDRLEKHVARLLGKERAIFMPSGTMSNQIALRVHCRPGDEFLCEEGCHIYNYEQGAFSQLSGVVGRTVSGDHGVLRLPQLRGLIRRDDEHFVRTRLVTIENTHNRGAGRVQPYDEVEAICDWARLHGLRTHLDGARLFNAVVASGIDAACWSRHFDTVSVCFSKGLGAPVGSALAGPDHMIREARRHRKLFGGGMRQAGILGAAALYALEHHIDRLRQDHDHAQLLADAVRAVPGLRLRPEQPDTNIVIFVVDPDLGSAGQIVERLRQAGVLVLAVSESTVRAVTHLDVSRSDAEHAAEAIQALGTVAAR
jgi:threonine aldolase